MNSYANEVNIVDKDFPIAPTHQVDNYELLTKREVKMLDSS